MSDATQTIRQYSDGFLLKKSKKLQGSIKSWAERNSVWQDCGFKSWVEHYDSPPDPGIPCAFLLCLDGGFSQLVEGDESWGLFKEFQALVDASGFWWDRMDSSTLVFMANDEELSKAYGALAEWDWTSSLIAPDFALIHESIFEYFHKSGGASLHKLSPRDFEVYLDSLFQGRGYRTILGPGSNDGGVDLRLYSSEITGDVLTLVQAKRYAPSRPIHLDAVQALTAAVDYEPADRGLFVTTSRFLPSAKNFTTRKANHVTLLAGQDVLALSELAAKEVAEKRGELVKLTRIKALMESSSPGKFDGQILHANMGYGISDNEFAICVKSSAGAALLCPIPKKISSHDGYEQAGFHIPDVSVSALAKLNRTNMFLAKITHSKVGTSPYLWGNRELYRVWDGKPCSFNICD